MQFSNKIVGVELDPTNSKAWEALNKFRILPDVPQQVRDAAIGWANNAFCYKEATVGELDLRAIRDIRALNSSMTYALRPEMYANDGVAYRVHLEYYSSPAKVSVVAYSNKAAATLRVNFRDDEDHPYNLGYVHRFLEELGATALRDASRNAGGQATFYTESTTDL